MGDADDDIPTDFQIYKVSPWASKIWEAAYQPEDLPDIGRAIGLNRDWTLSQSTVGIPLADRLYIHRQFTPKFLSPASLRS